MRQKTLSIVLGLFLAMPVSSAVAQSSAQTAGGIVQQEQNIQFRGSFEKTLRQKRQNPREEAAVDVPIVTETQGRKMYVEDIIVEGVTLLSPVEVAEILQGGAYANQELTFAQIQNIAARITAAYRKKGYVTSRAYVPPQGLQGGIVTIKVLEATMGEYDIYGNEYFSTELIQRRMKLQPGEPFDYQKLQSGIEEVNEHPDRSARMVLKPGQQAGATDVVLEVTDQNPIHVTFEYDNYASRFLLKDRFSIGIEHNNLTGHDDLFNLKWIASESNQLQIAQGRYIYPVASSWELGGYFLYSDTELAGDLSALNAEGEAIVVGAFARKQLVNTPTLESRLNIGFDYKDIENKTLGTVTSKDQLRVLKGGFDFDFEDLYGRNIASVMWSKGIPDIFGGSDAVNPLSSRSGAGGEFIKTELTYFRLHPMFAESSLLFKNFAQLSADELPASEQFLIGGPTSVRAYTPGEFAGDSGIYSALEWSFPFYGLDREITLPFTEIHRAYDALRWVAFYDIGTVRLESPVVGEEKSETLRGYGLGVRLNLPGKLDARVEVAWPHGDRPVDGRKPHTWVEFDVRF